MPWSMFLKAHWDAIAAADFFAVEVWTEQAGIDPYHMLIDRNGEDNVVGAARTPTRGGGTRVGR